MCLVSRPDPFVLTRLCVCVFVRVCLRKEERKLKHVFKERETMYNCTSAKALDISSLLRHLLTVFSDDALSRLCVRT